jgi:hypothetical protein
MNKKLELLSSKKFDIEGSSVVGGAGPTYGNYYGTNSGQYSPGSTSDQARMTYGDPNHSPPGNGQDNLTYNF